MVLLLTDILRDAAAAEASAAYHIKLSSRAPNLQKRPSPKRRENWAWLEAQ